MRSFIGLSHTYRRYQKLQKGLCMNKLTIIWYRMASFIQIIMVLFKKIIQQQLSTNLLSFGNEQLMNENFLPH
jgi:hypothetical protein